VLRTETRSGGGSPAIITRDSGGAPECLPAVAARLGTGGPAPPVAPSKFDFSHVLWYAGALIVIGALGPFSQRVAFGAMGPRALTLTALGYGAGLRHLGSLSLGPAGLEGRRLAC